MAEIPIIDAPDPDTTCAICYAEFLDPDDLRLHMSQMHQTPFKLCQFCSKNCSSLEDYALHIRDEHLLTLKCCKYCNRIFNDYDECRKHESKHYTYVAKSMYSCSQCQKLYSNVSELELHEFTEHSDSSEGVFLNECLPLLSSVLNIKAMKFLQSIGDEVVYVCVHCEHSTLDPQQYLSHLKQDNCQSLACNGCSSVYRNKKGLLRHFESHPECIGLKHVYKQCSECYKMFDVRLWKDHTKHCKAIKCKTCHVVFSSMYDLSLHQTESHPLTVTLESCKFCHKEFAGGPSLEKHIERAHSHDAHLYKYTCKICEAIFKHPKKLFAHFYSTHKDLEPYTCKICDKKFKIRKKFTIHIKLDHKSIGYIEFDENYHVFFSDKKSEKSPEVKVEVLVEKTENLKEQIEQSNNDSKKVTFQEKTVEIEIDNDQQLFSINSDFMSATETEGNVTEAEEKPQLKRKIRAKTGIKSKRVKKSDVQVISDSSDDDDEPLVELKKRVKKNRKNKLRNATWNRKKRKDVKDNKRRFICNICKKYCYTFQNYHNHVALHYKNQMLKCVKCSDTFKSQEELNNHYAKAHSTSRLTQTLKNLLEKRKKGFVGSNPDVNSTEKFHQTIRKVHIPKPDATATLKELNDKLSVQKFIESFTPEEAGGKTVEIDSSISIRPFTGPLKAPAIKITKCNLQHANFAETTLNMPTRFRQVIGETHKVTIREVKYSDILLNNVPEDRQETFEDETYFDDDAMDRNESIPEVAQEVMLEVSEEPAPKTLYIPHRVVLPKLPKEYNKIRIAHLQSEAPYYKIVKVADVLNPPNEAEKKGKLEKVNKKVDIKLPDGTKLVTVNPLAHLLGNTPVEKILENSKNKYYHPKPKDFEVAIAKAMLRLEKPEAFPKKRRKKVE